MTTAAGKTVAAVEAELGGDATIESVRRGDAPVPLTAACLLHKGDEVAVSGLRAAVAAAAHVIGPELGDPTDVDFIVETRDVVLTHQPMHGATVAAVVKFLRTAACHGVYLAGITRIGPQPAAVAPLQSTPRRRVAAVRQTGGCGAGGALLGEAEIPSNVTDFVYLGGGLVIGILIGMVPVPIAGATLSLGQRRRVAVRSRLRVAALATADVWQIPGGCHANL